jgi:hypothetical protein
MALPNNTRAAIESTDQLNQHDVAILCNLRNCHFYNSCDLPSLERSKARESS